MARSGLNPGAVSGSGSSTCRQHILSSNYLQRRHDFLIHAHSPQVGLSSHPHHTMHEESKDHSADYDSASVWLQMQQARGPTVIAQDDDELSSDE